MIYRNFLPRANYFFSHPKRFFSSSSNAKHLSYCISSWFRIPEKGMQEFEFLSRASGFIVKTGNWEGGQKSKGVLRIIASAHVILPFQFPNYYPVEQYEWLHSIGRENIQARLEIRKPNGEIKFSTVLANSYKTHHIRDLAALRAEDDDELISQLSSIQNDDGTPHDHFIFHDLRDTSLCPRDEIVFHGHRLIHTEDHSQAQEPCVVPGSFIGMNDRQQCFARTQSVLQMGMCGGPILDSNGSCVGTVEGIVADTAPPHLRGLATFVDSQQILKFIDQVQEEEELESL
mmetsp:Transcript_30734/g.98860  ORF Transcript_30734/g.98860 Transcript_30734/m.98860 type:complete len:288 (+) Transcript_30734:207-1070(+)